MRTKRMPFDSRTMIWTVCISALLLASQPLAQPLSRFWSDQERRRVEMPAVRLEPDANGEVRLEEAEAIALALKHNFNINVARHAPLLSEWSILEREAVYDPVAGFDFNWDRETIPTTSALQGGDSLTNIITSYTPSYSQFFSTGTSLDVSFTGTRDRTTNFFSSLVPAIRTQGQILLRQNLLEGFGRAIPDYQIEIARNELQISEAEFRRQASDIILQVQQAYWNLRFNEKDIEVKRTALEAARTVLEQNQTRFEVGRAARLTVAQSEAEVALREEQLSRATFNRDLAQDRLVALITSLKDPREFPGRIVVSDRIDTTPEPDSYDQLFSAAVEMRPEMDQADLAVANREVEVDLSRNQLRPNLDLIAGYQQYGLGGRRVIRDFSQGFTNPEIIDIQPGGFEDSLDQLTSGDFYGYVVGLELQLPIMNDEARARNARALVARDRARLSRRGLEQQIALEIRQALTRLELSRASIRSGQAAVEAAQERLEAEEARFEVGRGTTRELIEAQRDLLEAESVLVRAETEFVQSRAALDRAVGRTFMTHNIRLEEALQTNLK